MICMKDKTFEMTPQKALWFFKEELKAGKCSDDCLQCNSMEMAISALEKQIPKKVKYQNRHGEGWDISNKDYFHCPSCGRRLRNKQKDPHCGRCGQLLDWSQG